MDFITIFGTSYNHKFGFIRIEFKFIIMSPLFDLFYTVSEGPYTFFDRLLT